MYRDIPSTIYKNRYIYSYHYRYIIPSFFFALSCPKGETKFKTRLPPYFFHHNFPFNLFHPAIDFSSFITLIMQRTVFRATTRTLANEAGAVVKKNQNMGFIKKVVTDPGNIPILAANAAAGSLVLIFGARKLFFHPDIGIADAQRLSNDIQNEGPKRAQDADVFRQQTKLFGSIVQPLSAAIISLMTGQKQGVATKGDKWTLSFLLNTDVNTPLENTNHFDDDLFVNVDADEYALNQPNDEI